MEALQHWANRARIISMAELGMPNDEIAFALGIHISVLLAVFGDEIQAAVIQAKFEALQAFANLAKSGKNPAVTMAWVRFRCSNKKDSYELLGPMPPMRVLNHLNEVIGINGKSTN